ncbi:TAXI family TRAP transporter solute-binding subunit [Pelagibacterium limicola]|uniref:TAXI family TRAP transporter solute-binding subunit n=1 Tax=Pelagibacterium limicola TaxID=2791022 RepID=UPI0018AF97BF|nr:TAXI family TRAP transporter solute-binding subunit [Pelagibacterium limicola]
MKLRTLSALALAGTAMLMAGTANAQRYTIGTNPQGTVYFTIGGGLAATLQDALGVQVTVQPYTGASVYLPMISAGEVTLGLNSSLDLASAREGEFGEPMENLRVLARLWPLTVALVARNDLGITEVGELSGKRVVTDLSALRSMSVVSQVMLELSGLSTDDVENVTVAGLAPGMEGLTENSLDATLIATGIPLTQQAHATIPGGIRYLSVAGPDATSENADAKLAGLYLAELTPNPRLPEVTEPVTVGAFDVFISASSDLPDEDVTRILEALYDALPQLKTDYPALAQAGQDLLSLPSNTIPYHPAAVDFFVSKGLWTEENAARDAGL